MKTNKVVTQSTLERLSDFKLLGKSIGKEAIEKLIHLRSKAWSILFETRINTQRLNEHREQNIDLFSGHRWHF